MAGQFLINTAWTSISTKSPKIHPEGLPATLYLGSVAPNKSTSDTHRDRNLFAGHRPRFVSAVPAITAARVRTANHLVHVEKPCSSHTDDLIGVLAMPDSQRPSHYPGATPWRHPDRTFRDLSVPEGGKDNLVLVYMKRAWAQIASQPPYKFAHSLEAMKSNQVVIDASEDKLEYVAEKTRWLISEMEEAVNYRNKAKKDQLNDELVTEETATDDNVSMDKVSNKIHDNESNEVAITDSEVQNSVSGEEASCGADYAGLCSGEDKDSPVPREHDVTTPTDEVSPQKHGNNELKEVVKNSQAAKKNSFSNLPSYIVDSLTDVQEEGETEENKLNGRLFEMGTNEATLLDETMNTTNRISESEDHTVSSILSIISEVKDAGSVKRQMKHINAIKSCIMENVAQMTGKPLQHIRYSVFALGSSVYPNFCAFGHYMDHLLARLGGKRLLKVAEGDEMKGQRRAFRKWVADVFPAACEAFNVEDDSQFIKETFSSKLSMDTVRFVKAKQHQLDHALSKYHHKKVSICQLLRKTNLHSSDTSRSTLLLELDAGQEIQYQPGDHVGVFPCNRKEIVDGVLSRLTIRVDLDVPVQVQVLKANNTSNGVVKTWEPHDTVPSCSLRTLLTWFLDVTTPLAPIQLENLASVATDPEEQRRLLQLATNPSAYEEWRNWKFPHLLEVLTEFPSVRPTASLLVTHLNPLQPRFYSISSSPEVHPGQIHLTVAVVNYKTQGGKGPTHYGVCSNFLQDFPPGQNIHLFVRSAHNFSLPLSRTLPVIMVGPGTGIAPFRGFWQHKMAHAQASGGTGTIGHMWLFFGCQRRTMDLYHEEKEIMTSRGVLDKVFLALSREPSVPKTYVQDLLIQEAAAVYHMMVVEGGHFYVCGDCTMAQDVHQTLQRILMEQGNMTQGQAEGIMHSLKEEKRYHEDIFGITLHTTARIQMAAHADDGPHDVRGGVAA
uniref:nitric-oxide synthase (NADPH) n=1 Tax=Timema shepardi TaxID=629360 RepID=A0A7R9FWZ5_TIMSH|nr:unnamed protein product [Timema shepardi]